MCRSAEDCGLVLSAIAGKDPRDPTSSDRRFEFPEKAPERFRIGVIRDCAKDIQPEVRRNFEQSLKVLAQFCDIIEDVPFPSLPFGPAVGTIISAEGAAAFRDLIESGRMNELRSRDMHHSGYAASMTLAVDYLQAMRARRKMRRALEDLCGKYDALVAPARTTVAHPVGPDGNSVYKEYAAGPPIIPAGNVAGQPAISVPNGFGPHDLPTGIQFTGKCWSESRLLSLAIAYQQNTDWHQRRPKI
jgi:aspartyl-tRNA(Asn)/glutamyl-tRNA(Gln) amidotransferase subunit A